MQETPMVQLQQVSKWYPGPSGNDGEATRVLSNIDLTIHGGQTLAVTGPSGSGKSTLLNIIGALDRPSAGSVIFNGKNLSQLSDRQLARFRNRYIGFVFQMHHLLPQCTTLENVLVPTLADDRHADKQEADERARQLLETVGLMDRMHYRPDQLSVGQCQRVAIVRALINQPKLVLADEPTGALDHDAAGQLTDLLLELNRQQHVTLLIVTHASQLAGRMGGVLELRNSTIHGVGVSR